MNSKHPPGPPGNWKNVLWSDVPSSLVVFLVALPLCMGIAMASGMPSPASGLVTGIIGGIVVGILAGSPLQVSGPAAGLIVLVAAILHQQGLQTLGMVVLLAGLIQILAGIFRLAPWFRAVAPAVIQGMLAGIGAVIFLGQLHVLADGIAHPSAWYNLISMPQAVQQTLDASQQQYNHQAALLGLATIAIIVVWTLTMKKRTVIPGTLVAVLAVSAVAVFGSLQVKFIEVPTDMREAIQPLTLDALPLLGQWDVWKSALVIALVASAESLLCATAVDQLHRGPRTQFDRELIAQGIGNTLCGFLAVLPMTGVIVRSSANIDSGARTRLSAILHGLWLLAFVLLVPHWLNYIPRACLAGILVYTGYKLINVKAFVKLWNISKSEGVIFLATFLFIVFRDLLVGVQVGILLSALKLLYNFSHLNIRREKVSADDSRIFLHLQGAATFLRLPKLAEELERVPPAAELHIALEDLDYIDHACLDLMTNWAKQHESTGGRLIIDWDTLHACFRRENGGPNGSEGPQDRQPVLVGEPVRKTG